MEPLEQALAVVEGVVLQVCAKLGSEAQEHINHDQIFARAECQINNGLSVRDAIKKIASPVLWEVQEKREKKIIDVKRIRDELERSTERIWEFESAPESHQSEEYLSSSRGTLDLNSQGSSSEASVSGSTEEDKPEMGSREATRSAMNGTLSLDTSAEDDEISVLSPVPPKPAPLIVLSDDSSDSSRSDVFIVVPREDGSQSAEEGAAAPADKEGPQVNGSTVKEAEEGGEIHEELKDETKEVKEEVMNDESMPNDVGEARHGEEAGAPPEDSVPIGKNEGVGSPLPDTVLNDEDNEEKKVINGVMHQNLSSDGTTNGVTHHKQSLDRAINGVMSQQSQSSDGTVNGVTHQNQSSDKTFNGVMHQNQSLDVTMNGVTSQNQSLDILWEDAHYLCSLLPYFQLADVHQSMFDNYYHPDRRAHVLEEYIRLAVDRGEAMPDSVFHGLRAAKKRSHVEDGVTAVEKKIKVEHGTEPRDARKLLDDSLPSTSGANNLDVGSKSSNGVYGAFMVEGRTNGEHGNDREKWCKEKINFVSAVVCGVDKEVVRAHVESCHSDADVVGLIERFMGELEKGEPVVDQPEGERLSPLSLLRDDRLAGSAFQPVDGGGASWPMGQGSSSGSGLPGSSAEPQGADADDQAGLAADLEDRIMVQVATLLEMFTDADPDYLQERCVGINGDQAQLQVLVEELLRNKDYPRIEEYNKRQKRLEIKKKFIEGMSVEEFLEYFEDPEKVFCDVDKVTSPTYKENARAQLRRDLPYHLSRDIDNELRKHNYHYLPTLRALQECSKLSRRKTKRGSTLKEKDLDDIFIKELCYVRMQTEVKEHLLKKEENKRRAFRWAKAAHQLQECGCCFDDEVLDEDMDTCNVAGSKHKFCITCINRFAEEEIGQGRTSFRCLDGECKAEFSLGTLKRVMKPAVFSSLLERKQLEEIAAAGIEDLVACPYCNFQTIMPNEEDKVFKCLNPECMKDSCRFCKEPNHVPLRCEEVEKQHQRDARTFMENRMTEAMVRECWRCKKRFIKEDGCNKMRCSCGAMMCYICKKQIKGYDHFEDKPVPLDPSKCPLWSNSEKIHAEEVQDVAVKLRQEMDPRIELMHNPLNDVPQVPKHLMNKNPSHHQNPQIRIPPPAHQNRVRVRAHVPDVHPHQLHRMEGAYYFAFPPHHQHPPPAHQQVHPQLPRAVPAVAMPEVNGYQHHHYHHHHHHHHIRQPARYPESAINLQRPIQPPQMRDNLVDQINEFNEVMQEVRMRDPATEYYGDGLPWVQQQQAPRNQQQQQQQQQRQFQQAYRRDFMNEVSNRDIPQQLNERQLQNAQQEPLLPIQQPGRNALAPPPRRGQHIDVEKFQEYVDLL